MSTIIKAEPPGYLKCTHESLLDFPGQVPPALQQIVGYLRLSDTFLEQPTLFSASSLLEKAFEEPILEKIIAGLAHNQQELQENLHSQTQK